MVSHPNYEESHPGGDNQNTAANTVIKCNANLVAANPQSSSFSVQIFLMNLKMRGCMIAVLLLYALTTSCSAQGGQNSL